MATHKSTQKFKVTGCVSNCPFRRYHDTETYVCGLKNKRYVHPDRKFPRYCPLEDTRVTVEKG